jgi:hypothetical protein
MSTIKADTLSNVAGSQSVPVATVAQGSAKAWVNFNGTGTVAIRAAFNVTSITDNGTGDYTLNFTNAMPDASFAVFVNAGGSAIGNSNLATYGVTSSSTSTARVITKYGTPALDYSDVYVAIFR